MNADPFRIFTIFGTRPEAIKLAPVIRVLEEDKRFLLRTAVTGQHREMLDQVLEIFALKPDYDLELMEPEQRLPALTARIISGLGEILPQEEPDLVLVHGDTTTTLAAALTAFYQQIPVGHVEAGLRTGKKFSPFPEEMNRSLTDLLADIYFAPTSMNLQNLKRENISEEKIYLTGNTVIDAVRLISEERYEFPRQIPVAATRERGHSIVLLTAHRRENLGEKMAEIFAAVRELISAYSQIEVFFPVHLNPRIQILAERILGDHPRIHLLEPLDYQTFINLVNQSRLVLTDSGGIQEEAPGLGVPVVLLREDTERPEALEAGTVLKAGSSRKKIIELTGRLLEDEEFYQKTSRRTNPYGDGRAALRIKDALLEYFQLAEDIFQPFSFRG